MPPWWEAWPELLEDEVAAFTRRGLDFEVDPERRAAGEIMMRGKLEIEPGRQEEIAVVYPATFPFTRFSVFARNLTLNRHQHPFGANLCVFPRGSKHWRPSIRAADVVAERVPELLKVVKAGGDELREAEEPQGEPFTEYYTYWPLGGILVPLSALSLPPDVRQGKFEVRLIGSSDWLRFGDGAIPALPPLGQGVLSRVQGDGREFISDDGLARAYRGDTWRGSWIRLDEPIRADGADLLAELLGRHPELDKRPYNNGRHRIFGVVFPEEVRQGEIQDAWVFVVEQQPGQRKKGAKGIAGQRRAVLVRGMRAGADDLGQRIPELAALRERIVALAGLGALGKPVADEFARSLLGELRVLDSDVVDAGNAVRWSDGFRAAGVNKAMFTAADFAAQYPHTNVLGFNFYVGAASLAQVSPEAQVLHEWAANVDLIVELTAEANVTSAIAYLARRQDVPLVVGWSIEGAGGLVARIVPGKTGCYHCLELHIAPDVGDINTPKPPPREWVQPPSCAERTFPAPNLDLAAVAEMATRMAFGELCRGVKDGYPALRHDLYVHFLREPDGSLVDPPRWKGHDLPVHPDCPLCNSATS